MDKLGSRQSGLSLIELMVAMVIGLFLILGVTQIFVSNQTSYLFQQGQLGNTENGRFSVAMLSQELMRAGYRFDLSQPITTDNSLAGCAFPVAGAAVVAISETSFCIQYQATSKTDVNCQGTPLAAATQATIAKPYSTKPQNARPKVVERISFDAATGSITCTTAGATQQLVTGVRDARFEYGTGTTATPQTLNTFSTGPNASPIVVVRYTMLMQSPGTASIRDGAAAISPALADWNSRYSTNYNDTRSIYQIVQGSTMIRNLMP